MSFFIDAGPYVLAAITLALFIVFGVALGRAAAKPCPKPLPRVVPLAGSGAPVPPELLLPVRADEFMREWDIAADLDGMDWGP